MRNFHYSHNNSLIQLPLDFVTEIAEDFFVDSEGRVCIEEGVVMDFDGEKISCEFSYHEEDSTYRLKNGTPVAIVPQEENKTWIEQAHSFLGDSITILLKEKDGKTVLRLLSSKYPDGINEVDYLEAEKLFAAVRGEKELAV